MYNFDDLIKITERLTAEDGCPWDKVQTHESIRLNMIEEAYEAVDAIDKKDTAAITEELGDLLLQVVLHSDIAKRSNEFTIDDVTQRLCDKLISRHTHIFGSQKADNAEDALKNWEKEKAKEKSYISVADQLKKQPESFPALLKAQKIIKKSGFKADAEKFKDILSNLCPSSAGEFLFYACALCFQNGADAEIELNSFNNKFIVDLEHNEKNGKNERAESAQEHSRTHRSRTRVKDENA